MLLNCAHCQYITNSRTCIYSPIKFGTAEIGTFPWLISAGLDKPSCALQFDRLPSCKLDICEHYVLPVREMCGLNSLLLAPCVICLSNYTHFEYATLLVALICKGMSAIHEPPFVNCTHSGSAGSANLLILLRLNVLTSIALVAIANAPFC